eukprot:1299296-Prymnesium_polylepis.1
MRPDEPAAHDRQSPPRQPSRQTCTSESGAARLSVSCERAPRPPHPPAVGGRECSVYVPADA